MKTTMNWRICTCVCTVVTKKLRIYKSDVMNVRRTSATIVTGVMNIKPITKFVSAIAAMAFIVAIAMKWTNATIVIRSSVPLVPPYCLVNFAGAAYVKIVLLLVDGTFCCIRSSLFTVNFCSIPHLRCVLDFVSVAASYSAVAILSLLLNVTRVVCPIVWSVLLLDPKMPVCDVVLVPPNAWSN